MLGVGASSKIVLTGLMMPAMHASMAGGLKGEFVSRRMGLFARPEKLMIIDNLLLSNLTILLNIH